MLANSPPASLLYGIGDIHGMDHLLASLLARIKADAEAHGRPATLVFLGDAINRGAHTRDVLDRLITGPSRPGDRWIVLRGNHEQVMLDALRLQDEEGFQRWLKMGGNETLASYGNRHKRVTPAQACELIGSRHLRFLAAMPLLHLEAGYLFVHAGVEPGVALRHQVSDKLLHIRGRFFRKPHGLPYTVIHGHTPTEGCPMVGPGRIGVDTGAWTTGILTAVAIDSATGDTRFLTATAPREARGASAATRIHSDVVPIGATE